MIMSQLPFLRSAAVKLNFRAKSPRCAQTNAKFDRPRLHNKPGELNLLIQTVSFDRKSFENKRVIMRPGAQIVSSHFGRRVLNTSIVSRERVAHSQTHSSNHWSDFKRFFWDRKKTCQVTQRDGDLEKCISFMLEQCVCVSVCVCVSGTLRVCWSLFWVFSTSVHCVSLAHSAALEELSPQQ